MAFPRHDWYLKQWLKAKGVNQQWVADELGLQKSKLSRKATGATAYTREDINAISALLNIQPWELLMDPADAAEIMRLRAAVRKEAVRLVHSKLDEAGADSAVDREDWRGTGSDG